MCSNIHGDLDLNFLTTNSGPLSLLYLNELQDRLSDKPFDLVEASIALRAEIRIIIQLFYILISLTMERCTNCKSRTQILQCPTCFY